MTRFDDIRPPGAPSLNVGLCQELRPAPSRTGSGLLAVFFLGPIARRMGGLPSRLLDRPTESSYSDPTRLGGRLVTATVGSGSAHRLQDMVAWPWKTRNALDCFADRLCTTDAVVGAIRSSSARAPCTSGTGVEQVSQPTIHDPLPAGRVPPKAREAKRSPPSDRDRPLPRRSEARAASLQFPSRIGRSHAPARWKAGLEVPERLSRFHGPNLEWLDHFFDHGLVSSPVTSSFSIRPDHLNPWVTPLVGTCHV